MKNIIDTIEFWKDFLPDKRFSLRYKIGVMFLGEDFHMLIALAHANAKDIVKNAELYGKVPEAQAKLAILKAKHIARDIEDLWR